MSTNCFVSASAQIKISACDITSSTDSQKASQAKVLPVPRIPLSGLMEGPSLHHQSKEFHNKTLYALHIIMNFVRKNLQVY